MYFIEFEKKYGEEIPDISVLFNLFLLLKKGRNAMLLETDTIKYLSKIQEIFGDKFHYKFIDNNMRAFVSLKKLRIGNEPSDDLIAEILGFNCKGLPDPSKDRWVLNYYVNGEQFYVEICPTENSIKLREDEWSALAGKDTEIRAEITYLPPEGFIEEKILERNFEEIEEKYMEEFEDFLFNANVDLDVFSLKEFLHDSKLYSWLNFFIKEEEISPYRVFGFLTAEEGDRFKNELTSLILAGETPQLPKIEKVLLRDYTEEEKERFLQIEKELMQTLE